MKVLLGVLVWSWLVLPGAAQVTTGSIAGYVSDPSGRPVAGARVTATSIERGIQRDAATGDSGFFRLAELPPASYRVTVERSGFQSPIFEGVAVTVNSTMRVDVRLQLEAQRESVLVRDTTVLLRAGSSDQGATFEQALISRLPLNRRDFLQLALLVPGVLPPVEGSELSQRGSVAMHANGGREEFNNFLLDGADNNDPYTNRYALHPPVDGIQEFRIAASSYSAEFGRGAGAQVNVITRSGSNTWHGDLYEHLRNRVLDARNFFDAEDKPRYARNQFGAGIGGPVAKDRAFVFANFDALLERRGFSRLATVPGIDERAGRLASLGRPVVDPFTRQPFAGSIIPAERISPLARRVLDLFPLPNRPGASANYLAQPVGEEDQWQWSARLDQHLGARHHLMLRYSHGRQDILQPFAEESTDLPGFGEVDRNRAHNAVVTHQAVLDSRAILTLRAAANTASRSAYPQNFRSDVGRLWGVDWLNVRERDFGFPFFNVAGFSPAGDVTQLPIDRDTGTYQVAGGMSLSRGAHALRTGVEISHSRLNGVLDYLARGSLSFSGALSGTGLSDLLLGLPSFGIQAQFDNAQVLRATATRVYLQDDWRARPGLTLNLGLRYEYNTPPVDPRDRMAAFDVAGARLVNVGSDGVPRAGIRADANNVAPRAGFAWAISPRRVIRGGYGMFYDSGMMVVNSSLYFNPPYFNVRVFFPTAMSLLTLQNPFPRTGGITPPVTVNTLSPDLTSAYLQHWNLGVQQQIGAATVLQAAYVASKGTHLIRSRDLNQPRPGVGDLAARRPRPAFGGIFFIESGANSSFHSLQLSAERRLSHGVSLLAAYTWSKSIDDTSAFLGNRADRNFPQDSRNNGAERALSSYDTPHRATAAWAWLPVGRAWWSRNFEFKGIAAMNSGQPFTPVLRFDNSNTGNTGGVFGSDRPNVIGDPGLSGRSAQRWFNTAAFAVPPRFTFGNAGRNILRGPAYFSLDVALARRFRISERASLVLDAQAFNLLNRANFDLPERLADEPATFGRIFSAKPPRQLQFAARLRF